jgi:DamX protein
MLDNDEFTYSYQKRPGPAMDNRQAERALITVDRSQKLDLLIHLLTNLQQSLIVCGPEDIGKTTLLKTFENGHKDIWPICFVQGSSALSFESVVSQLSRFLNLSNSSVNFDLSSLRAFCSKQKVVLIIDDAGDLMPGLLGELMDFADSLSGLRLVFALNNDALQARTASESAINDCHFIEVPPLNQRQCLEYLQNLSAQPNSPISFAAVTDALVESMYRKTLGVPGKILAEFPKLKHAKGPQTSKVGLWLGIVGIVVATGLAVRAFLPAELFEQSGVDKVAEPIQAINEPAVTTPPAIPVEQTLPAESAAAPVTDSLAEPELPEAVAATQPETIELSKAPKEVLTNLAPSKSKVEPVVQKDARQEQNQETPLHTLKGINPEHVEVLNPQSPKLAEKPSPPKPVEINQPVVNPPQIPLVAKVEPVIAPVVVPTLPVVPVVKAGPEVLPMAVVPETGLQVQAKPAENKPAEVKAVEAKPIEKPAPVVPSKPAANAKPESAATTADAGDHEWIMAQPGNNYTVQVMVLSSKDSVNRFMRKHAELRSDLKFYPIGKEGQEKYAIIYGSFATPIEALNQKSDMPAEFTNGLVKRMKQVQRENRKN